LSGRNVRAILEENGFLLIRQRGSHMVLQKKVGNGTVTAVIPDHAELRIGTLMSIIRQSQLPRGFFEV